jgi:hypothetical protein
LSKELNELKIFILKVLKMYKVVNVITCIMLQITEASATVLAETMTMNREHHTLTRNNAQMHRKETQLTIVYVLPTCCTLHFPAVD